MRFDVGSGEFVDIEGFRLLEKIRIHVGNVGREGCAEQIGNRKLPGTRSFILLAKNFTRSKGILWAIDDVFSGADARPDQCTSFGRVGDSNCPDRACLFALKYWLDVLCAVLVEMVLLRHTTKPIKMPSSSAKI